MPYPVAPPQKVYPVPAGRAVPMIWLISLITLAVVGVGLALGGSYLVQPAPGPQSTSVYSNSLATDDGQWISTTSGQGQCQFQNGGLDVINTDGSQLAPTCTLQSADVGDLRLSVRILPQAQTNDQLAPAIFVHGSVAILFDDTTGDYAVYDPVTSGTAPIATGYTDQWHTSGYTSNTVVIQVQSATYTIAINGAVVYSGDFSGAAETLPASGAVGLGAYVTSGGTTLNAAEAIYADFSLSTP
jgi:hypothetical protein